MNFYKEKIESLYYYYKHAFKIRVDRWGKIGNLNPLVSLSIKCMLITTFYKIKQISLQKTCIIRNKIKIYLR